MAETDIHSESLTEEALDNWYLKSRHNFIAAVASRQLSGPSSNELRILDAGCGSGGVTEVLTKLGYRVTSVDMDAAAVAKGLAKGRLLDARVADVTQLPFPDSSFDMVVCSEVLEHVQDDAKALRELIRVAKRRVLISVPAHAYLWTSSDTILGHFRRYSRPQFRNLLAHSGAEPLRMGRCHVIPGLGIMAYKTVCRLRKKRPDDAARAQVPNAMRFRLPKWFDTLLYGASSAELALSGMGLIPWGSAWWAVLEKR